MIQMCGPTGIGFLYGKSDILSSMPPFLGKLLVVAVGDFLLSLSLLFFGN